MSLIQYKLESTGNTLRAYHIPFSSSKFMYVKYFNMSVWHIFLLYFLKFDALEGSSFYQQLYLLGMECGNSITSHIILGSTRIVRSRVSLKITEKDSIQE